MTERQHTHAVAHVESSSNDPEIAPGRSRSSDLVAPTHPIVSGLIRRRARDANGVAQGADQAVANAASCAGHSLPEPIMRKFGSSLGADLSGVRLHTGSASGHAAEAVGAKAYTVGQDIHFAAGQYDPSSSAGQHLLAHEVAHTVQQQGGTPTRQNKLEVSTPQDGAELEADRAADAMVAGAAAQVSGHTGTHRQILRDRDDDMQNAAALGADVNAKSVEVQTIYNHSVVADQTEAQKVLSGIRAASPKLEKLIAQDGKYTHTLADNAAAAFKVEQYLSSVGESGNFLGEFQASYFQTKRDYGQFVGTFSAFLGAHGKLGGHNSLTSGLNTLKTNPAFAQMFQKYEQTRDKLKDDANTLQQNQDSASGKRMELQSSMMQTRSAVATSLAQDKEGKLAGIVAEIDSTVDTLMIVGQIAMTCVSGVMAMGSGGFDVSTLLENDPTGFTPPSPTPTPAKPDVNPSQHTPNPPGMNPNGNGASINPQPAQKGPTGPNGTGATINKPTTPAGPNDQRTYSGKPPASAQAAAAAKNAANAGISLAGGPKAVLKAAITKLEESKIDVLAAEIGAAKVEADLSAAAAAAAHAASVKQQYITAMNTMIQNVETMMTDKQNLENETDQLVGMAKSNPNVSASLRIVTAGDKFLSQVDLTARLGQECLSKGHEATKQRSDINGGTPGDPRAPVQLKYYSTDPIPLTGIDKFLHGKVWYKLETNDVTLKSQGHDSLGGTGGTGADVQAAVNELNLQKADVQAKRDQAQSALGMNAPVGQAHTS